MHTSSTFTRLFPGLDPSAYPQNDDPGRPLSLPDLPPHVYNIGRRMSYPEEPSRTCHSQGGHHSHLHDSEPEDIRDSVHTTPHIHDPTNKTRASVPESLPRYSQLRSRFSAEYPIPPHIRTTVQAKYINLDGKRDDFDYLRYTAVKMDPDGFSPANGYDPRPSIFGHDTEVLVCVSYAGEDVEGFARTFHAVLEGVREFSFLKPSSFWNQGAPAWQKAVVCVVVDGIDVCDERILGLFTGLGVYQDGIMGSTTGYMLAFHGSLSAFRMSAITGRPLEGYLDGDPTRKEERRPHFRSRSTDSKKVVDDDRLPREIVLRKGKMWHTGLALNARAQTDIPSSPADLVEQRARRLRQSLTTFLDVFRMTGRLRRTAHNDLRTGAIFIQMIHNIHTWLLLWFSLSGCLLTTFCINNAVGSPPSTSSATGFPFGPATPTVNKAIQVIHVSILLLQFLFALSHRPKRFSLFYSLSFIVFALIQLYMLVNLIYMVKRLVDYRLSDHLVPLKLTKHPDRRHPDFYGADKYGFIGRYYTDIGPVTVIASVTALFGMYAVEALATLDVWHLVTSWAQYLVLWSAHVNVLNVYAVCNVYRGSASTHDGKVLQSTEKKMEHGQAETKIQTQATGSGTAARGENARLRTMLVVAGYILCNVAVCLAAGGETFISEHLDLGGAYWRKIWFLRVWMWANASLLLVRGAAMVWFVGRRMVGSLGGPRVV